MENRNGLYSPVSSGWTSMRNEDFQEEDVWGAVKERKDSDSDSDSKFMISSSSIKEPTLLPKIPTATRNRMILKSKSKSEELKIIQQHSAPVNIPDWSRIYGKSCSRNSSSWLDPDSDGNDNDHGFARSSFESDEEEEEEEEDNDEGNLIPPHEWIARRVASSRISSFSVCEGAGRTLKGRDLSRVRNAVLTKTGFLES